ncbi:MAG: hypothetical protein CVU18_16455 [Betaproteobacteria bacterium HGW-Betaproteobacteria-12]|nr:MAG: hypothetical protein CVU18_16455 [Betaproteobacteria bacterium HGW-Betaproteobacteria-12]
MYRLLLGALLLFVLLGSHVHASDDVEVELDLYHFAGNLSEAQRAALLADSAWTVRAGYSPLLRVPGVTASWSRCGLLNLPCLTDDAEEIILMGSAIRREGTNLRFTLPHYVGVRRFRLANVRVQLPNGPYGTLPELETFFYVAREDGVNSSPVVMDGGSFRLAGSIRVEGVAFRPRFYCPGSDICRGVDADGRYDFKPMHRFAFYRKSYQFPGKDVAPLEPLPADLKSKKIYRASLKAHEIDGYRIEFVDISATAAREECSSDDLQYEILYVNGVPITYARWMPDPDPSQCRGHYRQIEWGNDKRPIAHGATLVEWINQGSSITYANWNARCTVVEGGKFGRCNVPAPSAELEAEIRADARRVRAWFPL